jgi:hypothetical protein
MPDFCCYRPYFRQGCLNSRLAEVGMNSRFNFTPVADDSIVKPPEPG